MVLDRLRNETQDLHQRIEKALDMPATCADLSTYRRFLCRALGYYRPIETALARFAWQAAGLDFAPRCKVPMLVADLRALGVDATALQQLGQCKALPEPITMAGAFGVMYVLEGATLGGQLMLRMVQTGLGLSPASGAAFHNGYGRENGLRWRAFRACAERHLIDAAQCDEAVQMAQQTFETYGAWLTADPTPAQPSGQTLPVAA